MTNVIRHKARDEIVEVSFWDDGEKGFAVAFLSIQSYPDHKSGVDCLGIRKSEVDKSDSADEIIDLTHLIPSDHMLLWPLSADHFISGWHHFTMQFTACRF